MRKSVNISNYPENCLFGTVKVTKHNDVDQYKYSGYDIEFDRKGSYSVGNEIGRNVIIFGIDMTSTAKIDNRKRSYTKLEHKLSSEEMYSINFTKENPKFCLSLNYNGVNNYLFVNGKEIHKFTGKDSNITPYELCLGNITKGWSIDNMKKNSLKGYVYDFSVGNDAISVSDITDIHKYLLEKNKMK